LANEPPKRPIGVLTASQTNTSPIGISPQDAALSRNGWIDAEF
jgi:hypothetical protein